MVILLPILFLPLTSTLILLADDEIVMSKPAALGAVDPQLGQSPAASLLKVVEQKSIAEIDDQTLSHDSGQRSRVTCFSGACPSSRTLYPPTVRAHSLAKETPTRSPVSKDLGAAASLLTMPNKSAVRAVAAYRSHHRASRNWIGMRHPLIVLGTPRRERSHHDFNYLSAGRLGAYLVGPLTKSDHRGIAGPRSSKNVVRR